MSNLANKKNLLLAWKRVRTAQNIGYKRFYRRVFDGLDIGIDYQIDILRGALRVQTYQPHPSQRVLAAKPSGLQRPFTFLDPRDQIVLQAIVNIAADRMEPKRRLAVARNVCSNRIAGGGSIHFFKPWQDSYGLFRRRIEARLKAGYVYLSIIDDVGYNHKRTGDFMLGGKRFTFRMVPTYPAKLSKEFLLVDLLNNLKRLPDNTAFVLQNLGTRLSYSTRGKTPKRSSKPWRPKRATRPPWWRKTIGSCTAFGACRRTGSALR